MTKKRELEETTTTTEETTTTTTTTTTNEDVDNNKVEEVKKKQKLEEPVVVAEEKKDDEKKVEEKEKVEEEKKDNENVQEEKKVDEKKDDEKKEEEEKKEEKPVATTSLFGFNSSASPFSFASSFSSGSPFSFNLNSTSTFTNAFGKPPVSTNGDSTSTTTTENNESNGSEKVEGSAQEDFSKTYTPIFAHVQQVEQKTGEEEENTLCSAKAKLYILSEQEYKERGVGILKLNQNLENKSRLIMIADGSKRSLLNVNIFSKMVLESPNEKSIKFVAFEDGKINSFFIRMGKADEIKSFLDKINQQIKHLKDKESEI